MMLQRKKQAAFMVYYCLLLAQSSYKFETDILISFQLIVHHKWSVDMQGQQSEFQERSTSSKRHIVCLYVDRKYVNSTYSTINHCKICGIQTLQQLLYIPYVIRIGIGVQNNLGLGLVKAIPPQICLENFKKTIFFKKYKVSVPEMQRH